MYYIYVLLSILYKTRYVGNTENVAIRFKQHYEGKDKYTKGRKPWKLIYQESFNTRTEARKRELFLKSGQGRKLLDELLKFND